MINKIIGVLIFAILFLEPASVRSQDDCQNCFGRWMDERGILTKEIKDLKRQVEEYEKSLPALANKYQRLSNDKGKIQRQLDSRKQQLNDRTQDITTLKQRIEALTDAQRKNPELILNLIESSQQTPEQNNYDGWSYEEHGKVHIVKDLVIGTLKVSLDKAEAAPNEPVNIVAVFTPHPVLKRANFAGATEEKISWYIEVKYSPEKIKDFQYVEELSNSKPLKREVNTESPERWTWRVIPRDNFQIDKPHIIGNISYQMGNDNRQVDFNPERLEIREKYIPGLITIAFKWLKENATIILSILASFLTLVTTILAIEKVKVDTKISKYQLKISELELKIKELEANPSPPRKAEPIIEKNPAESEVGAATSLDNKSSVVAPIADMEHVKDSNNN